MSYIVSSNLGKRLKSVLLSRKKTGAVAHVFLADCEAPPSVHVHVTIQELRAFMKDVEKRNKKYGHPNRMGISGCWNHLSPDVSIWVDSRKRKRRSK